MDRADLIVRHAKVVTVDRQFSVAEAMAVRAGKILKVGTDEEILATRGPRTQKDRQMEWIWREHLMNSQRHQYMVPSEDYQTTQENR